MKILISNKVGIIIEIKRLENGSILYSVPYNEDINKENLNNWLKYIKSKNNLFHKKRV